MVQGTTTGMGALTKSGYSLANQNKQSLHHIFPYSPSNDNDQIHYLPLMALLDTSPLDSRIGYNFVGVLCNTRTQTTMPLPVPSDTKHSDTLVTLSFRHRHRKCRST